MIGFEVYANALLFVVMGTLFTWCQYQVVSSANKYDGYSPGITWMVLSYFFAAVSISAFEKIYNVIIGVT